MWIANELRSLRHNQKLKKAALYSLDRKQLFKLITQKSSIKVTHLHDRSLSAWNGNMDYAFNEKSFSREENGNLSRQMFIREGGLKHYTAR